MTYWITVQMHILKVPIKVRGQRLPFLDKKVKFMPNKLNLPKWFINVRP